MLFREWDANDRDRAKDCEDQMRQRNPETAEHNPDQIHHGGETSGWLLPLNDMSSERQQRKHRQLDTLTTKRNSNDGCTENEAAEKVLQKQEYPPTQSGRWKLPEI